MIEQGYVPFPVPVDPPTTEPDDTPLVSATYNAYWTKYLLGVIGALLDPQAYAGDDSTKELAVKRAHNLMDIIAAAPGLAQFRQTDCTLEISTDNGATWQTLFQQCDSDLTGAVILAPDTLTRNSIVPTTNGNIGLLVYSTGHNALLVNQSLWSSGAHDKAALRVSASDGAALSLESHNGKPLVQIEEISTLIDVDGRLLLQPTTDPSLGSATRGALWLGVDGANDDLPYYVQKDHTGAYHKASLRGADGTNGTNGSNGADGADGAGITAVTLTEGLVTSSPSATLTETPDIQHQQLDLTIPTPAVVTEVTAEALGSAETPTVTLSTRTDGDLKLAFGIPAGAAGAAGYIAFPDLPEAGGDTVVFDMIVLGDGSFLPWKLPAGYTFQVTAVSGLWYQLVGVPPLITGSYATTGAGGTDVDTTYQNDGLKYGSIVAISSDTDSNGAISNASALIDPTSAITLGAEKLIELFQKLRESAYAYGYLVATIAVTPTSATPFLRIKTGHLDASNSEVYDNAGEYIDIYTGVPIHLVSSVQDPANGNDYSVFGALHTDYYSNCYVFSITGSYSDSAYGANHDYHLNCSLSEDFTKIQNGTHFAHWFYIRSATPIDIYVTLTIY